MPGFFTANGPSLTAVPSSNLEAGDYVIDASITIFGETHTFPSFTITVLETENADDDTGTVEALEKIGLEIQSGTNF